MLESKAEDWQRLLTVILWPERLGAKHFVLTSSKSLIGMVGTSSALLSPLWLTMPCFSFVWSDHAISYPNLHMFVSEIDAIYSYSWETSTHWDCLGQTPMCGPPVFEEWLPLFHEILVGLSSGQGRSAHGLRWSFSCFSTRNFSHKWTDKIRPGGSWVW